MFSDDQKNKLNKDFSNIALRSGLTFNSMLDDISKGNDTKKYKQTDYKTLFDYILTKPYEKQIEILSMDGVVSGLIDSKLGNHVWSYIKNLKSKSDQVRILCARDVVTNLHFMLSNANYAFNMFDYAIRSFDKKEQINLFCVPRFLENTLHSDSKNKFYPIFKSLDNIKDQVKILSTMGVMSVMTVGHIENKTNIWSFISTLNNVEDQVDILSTPYAIRSLVNGDNETTQKISKEVLQFIKGLESKEHQKKILSASQAIFGLSSVHLSHSQKKYAFDSINIYYKNLDLL